MRECQVVNAARFLSFVIAFGTVLVGALYTGPETLVRRPLPPGQESIVVIIDHFFPVWPFLFAFTGAALAMSAYFTRGLAYTHAGVVVTWSFYGLSLILAPIQSEPPSPILAGVIAMIFATINYAVVRLWAALGVK